MSRAAPWRQPAGELRPGPLAVRALGEGPPTLLLHGLLGSHRSWGRAFDALADDGLLLAPDLLGFGASPRPPSGYGPEAHGQAILEAIAPVKEQVLVVGHSLGALLALWLAKTHPERVRAVVAFAPPLFRNPAHARQRLGGLERFFSAGQAWRTWLARTACTSLCGARPKLAARLFSLLRTELPSPLVEDATRHSWASYSETVERVILSAQGAQWLRSARPPVLLIAGSRDRYLDLQFLGELAAPASHIELRVWPGEDHDLPLTQPARCLRAIERWRDR